MIIAYTEEKSIGFSGLWLGGRRKERETAIRQPLSL